MQDKIAEAVTTAMPKSLDDIIRTRRDRASLRLSTADEIAALATPLSTDHPPKGEIDDWRLITLLVVDKPLVFLVGNNEQKNWMTSLVTGVDLQAGLLSTKSGSVYRMIGEASDGEPPMQHLLHICAVLHQWGGIGQMYGVPYVFY